MKLLLFIATICLMTTCTLTRENGKTTVGITSDFKALIER